MYKVGDKIEVVEKVDGADVGEIGKVIDADSRSIGVEFEEYSTNRHSCCEKCKNGHGYWFNEHEIKLIEDETKVSKGNFKIKALEDYDKGEWFTKGKIYECINGTTTYDDGYQTHGDDTFEKFIDGFKETIKSRGKFLVEFKDDEIQEQSITITRNGNKTIATLIQDGVTTKTKIARCHADDEYDFAVGAKWAFKRLVGVEKVVEEIKANTDYNFRARCVKVAGIEYIVGKIYNVVDGNFTGEHGYVYGTNFKNIEELNKWSDSTFELVEDKVEPIVETTNTNIDYNFTVKCTESYAPKWYTIGKEYKITDGIFSNDRGDTNYRKIIDIKDLNRYASAIFELVESKPQIVEVKRQAKVGEFVKVVNADDYCGNEYANGDILKVISVDSDGDVYYKEEDCSKLIYKKEYVVLEGYTPPTEEIKVKEVSREAKIGEYVKIVDDYSYNNGDYKNGDILKIIEIDQKEDDRPRYAKQNNVETVRVLNEEEYVVLENYIPNGTEKVFDDVESVVKLIVNKLADISSADLLAEISRRMKDGE